MARYGVSTALVALTVLMSPAAAQSGVPPLSEFEAECRQGNIIAPSCERIIFGLYAEVNGTTPDKVRCDGAALWRERDAQPADFAAMAWPDAIGLLVVAPGVCSLDVAVSAPTCAEGSPDPVVVKSFTATPDDTYQQGALRLDYVLTNTLDSDLDYVRGSLTWLDTAGEIRFAHSLQESQLIHAGADFQSTMMLLNGTQVLQDAPAMTVMACTVLIIDTNEVEQAF